MAFKRNLIAALALAALTGGTAYGETIVKTGTTT